MKKNIQEKLSLHGRYAHGVGHRGLVNNINRGMNSLLKMLPLFVITIVLIGATDLVAANIGIASFLPFGLPKTVTNEKSVMACSFVFRTTDPNHPNYGSSGFGGGGSGKDGESEAEKAAKEISDKVLKSIGERYPHLKDSQKVMDDIAGIQAKLATIKDESDYEAFKKSNKEVLETLAIDVKNLQTKANPSDTSYKGQIKTWLEEKKEDLKALYGQKGKTIELELKSVGDISLGSGQIVGTVPQYPIWGAPDFNLIGTFIENYISVSATGMPSFPYTEMIPKDGDYAFVSEAAIKPEIDFRWETRYVAPQKVAAWERLSEEVMADVPRIMSLANQLLVKKHNIKKQRGIISGNGVAPNPLGLRYIGRHFNASNVPATVTAPNIFDVINACVLDIATTHNYTDEMPYTATLVLMHPTDYFTYIQSPKDEDLRPMFNYEALKINSNSPQITNAWSGSGMNSLTIVPTLEIPAGNVMVCDASKYNLVNYIPYTVRIGWINDDFIHNQFVILAESRFFTYVKQLDRQAFIYDNIDTIMDAIEGTVS